MKFFVPVNGRNRTEFQDEPSEYEVYHHKKPVMKQKQEGGIILSIRLLCLV
jgi:hypothetical protein